MTEDELQHLRDAVVDMCNEMVANYDWDKAFKKYMEIRDERQ